MRNYRAVAIVLILVGLLSVPAQAQVTPGRWEKIEALGVGPPIHSRLEKRGSRKSGGRGSRLREARLRAVHVGNFCCQ